MDYTNTTVGDTTHYRHSTPVDSDSGEEFNSVDTTINVSDANNSVVAADNFAPSAPPPSVAPSEADTPARSTFALRPATLFRGAQVELPSADAPARNTRARGRPLEGPLRPQRKKSRAPARPDTARPALFVPQPQGTMAAAQPDLAALGAAGGAVSKNQPLAGALGNLNLQARVEAASDKRNAKRTRTMSTDRIDASIMETDMASNMNDPIEMRIVFLRDQLNNQIQPEVVRKKLALELRGLEDMLRSQVLQDQMALERAARMRKEQAILENEKKANMAMDEELENIRKEKEWIAKERQLIRREKEIMEQSLAGRDEAGRGRPSERTQQSSRMPSARRDSKERDGKLSSVIMHMTKPIANIIDPEKRDDPEYLARNMRHLEEINEDMISRALYAEPVIKELLTSVSAINRELGRLRTESRTSARALAEKTGAIIPNPDHTYPAAMASETMYTAAMKAMQLKVRVIERGCTFQQAPYNFIAELCAESNNVASNFGLTREQQRELILSYVPSQDPTFHALKRMGTLEGIFRAATDGSSKICTRAELSKQIADWTLDTSSAMKLTISVDQLLVLLEKQEGEPKTLSDQVILYRRAIQRIKQLSLPAAIAANLDEADIRIMGEDDVLELMRHLMAPLRKCIGYKLSQRHEKHVKKAQVKSVQEKAPQPQQHQQKQQNQQQNQQQFQQKQNQQKRNNNGGQQNNRRQGQAKRSSFVAQWPDGKNYLAQGGNKLSKECEEHFRGFCYKCGNDSHVSTGCRFYTDSTAILSLCCICKQGFHAKCKNPKYAKGGKNGNKADDSAIVKAVEATVSKLLGTHLGARPKTKKDSSSDDSE